jgi:peptidoglycan/xylan/chitin deacetylase (PgdA/CDA1 family)
MAHDGTIIGSHTLHHSYLPHVQDDHLNEEVVESKQVIESRIGRAIHVISYPIGGFTARAQGVVKQAGYRAACTTNRRTFEDGIDRFALRRIKITERDGAALLFYAKLSGYYNMFRRLKPPA